MRYWTTTEAAYVKRERAAGKHIADIAAHLGRSCHSVYSFLRYNYPPKANAEALARRCPDCGAKPGERCFRARTNGRVRLRKTFHAERFSG